LNENSHVRWTWLQVMPWSAGDLERNGWICTIR
jgi:hypothetical protein